MKTLLLLGGGHAHMVTLSRLRSFVDKGFRVIVIQPSEFHYYSGMGPGLLGGRYQEQEVCFNTKKTVETQGGTFILGCVKTINPKSQEVQLEDGNTVYYDVVSCNTGSYVATNLLTSQEKYIYSVKPIEKLQYARDEIVSLSTKRSISIGVVGGGPSSIEIGGNIWELCQRNSVNRPEIAIFTGHSFMADRPKRVQKLARKLLRKKEIKLIEDGYVRSIKNHTIYYGNTSTYQVDLVFVATGVRPSPIFKRSGLAVGSDGGLRVNSRLQSIEFDNIFGGGDCIYYEENPLDKVGVYAVRQNMTLYKNLMASLEGRKLHEFDPNGQYLLIYNLGGGVGIFSKYCITFSGRLAFWLKNYIDKKFMHRYQKS